MIKDTQHIPAVKRVSVGC